MEKIELNNQSLTGKQALQGSGARLTLREREILRHAANGKTNRKIAAILKTSEQTVKNRMSIILLKLNAKDRAHATSLAIRKGWI